MHAHNTTESKLRDALAAAHHVPQPHGVHLRTAIEVGRTMLQRPTTQSSMDVWAGVIRACIRDARQPA
jgi:hypothetical protein